MFKRLKMKFLDRFGIRTCHTIELNGNKDYRQIGWAVKGFWIPIYKDFTPEEINEFIRGSNNLKYTN